MIIEVDRAAAVFRKRAETSEEVNRLRQEARVLEVARHPGVVRLLGSEPPTLTLSLVVGLPLSEWSPTGTDELHRVAVAAATTLADLHDIGVVHRAITAEHIMIDDSGQPILCSFGRGAAQGGAGAGAGDAAGDVASLSLVLRAHSTGAGSLREILTAAARGGAGRNRLTARRLATLLAATGPQHIRRRPTRAVAVTVAAVTVSAALLPVVMAMGSGATRVPSPPCARSTGCRAASPDRLPCPSVDLACQPLPHAAGIVATPTGHYRIGRPDDVVVVGRWRCGRSLPAVLRPVTGELWVWDFWAGPSRALPARLLRRIPGARSIGVVPDPSGCDRMRVLGPGGEIVVVNPNNPA